MSKAKYLLAFVVAAVLALAMAVPAMAADNGTLTVSNAMKGQTYTAYKVFNAVYANASDMSKGVTYTVPSSLESKITADSPFELSTATASNGEKIVVRKATATDTNILTWVKANASQFDPTGTPLTYNETNGTASASLPYGYYYVSSTLGTVCSIDSLNSAVTVVDKNESKPTGPTKVITAEDSSIIATLDQTGKELANNDAAVGSIETFKVEFKATNWVESEESDTTAGTGTGTKTRVTEWNFQDSPTGLNIAANTVTVTVNGTAVYQNGAAVDNSGVTVSGGDTSALTVKIPFTNATGGSLYATQTAGSEYIPVVITYDATVTAAAATAVAPNNVTVKYNNATTLGTATTNTYTYKFQLDKIKNQQNNYGELTGAKFQLYASDGTTLLKFSLNGTTYTYNPAGTVDTIDMTANAKALIQGLDNADYVLKETQAPAGYNKGADTTIGAAQLKRVDQTIADETGIASDSGVINVVNEQGTELPSTGGIGTTIIYIVGGIMILLAVVFLITKRRVAKTNKDVTYDTL